MSFVGIEIERSPAKRRDGSRDILPGKFTIIWEDERVKAVAELLARRTGVSNG